MLKKAGKKFILLLPTKDHVDHYKRQIALKHGGIFGSSIVDLNGLVNMIDLRSDSDLPQIIPNYEVTFMLQNIIQDRVPVKHPYYQNFTADKHHAEKKQ